ncbi:SMI1/KNR4 family protein [Halalkalibacter urbisdiaboli]|uniref:SMI1/KNR4 family protein n=1 Tax=Halalkalibacter urbisdiaboli TaxID=1960589 RepID=UPI000B44C4FD|nr:SMI1/KNR4 family protein [Halalkalibacter urbisdiaboli]
MSILFYEGTGFWKSPTEYKPGEALTSGALSEIEQKLDVRLPKEYISLMQQQNGGNLSFGYIPFEDGDVVWIPYFQELEVDAGVGLSTIFAEECGLPTKMVLIAGDFETWLALDYRGGVEPAVVYWQQTLSESGESVWEEYRVADTFSQLLRKLFRKVK